MIYLILSLFSFDFDGFKKFFNFTDEAIELFLFFYLALVHDFFKALIKIQENELVSWFIEEL